MNPVQQEIWNALESGPKSTGRLRLELGRGLATVQAAASALLVKGKVEVVKENRGSPGRVWARCASRGT